MEDPSTLAPLPRPTTADARGRNPDATSADRVELSAGARLLQQLRAGVGTIDDPDAAHIARLRARVVANAYQPDATAIAKSLVTELAADLVV